MDARAQALLWALLGAAILAAYGVVAALQPISEFGRVYAAYGGVFIALALLWGIVVDGFQAGPVGLVGSGNLLGWGGGHAGLTEGLALLSPNCR
jgi:drug/metabolite transporter superfamily protein YnfA